MNYFTIKLSKLQIENLLGLCKSYLIKDENKYVLFHSVKDKCEIIAYTTGSVVVKGNNIYEKVKLLKEKLGIVDYEAIGSDEVGTGDLFGPVVVCAALVRKQDFEMLDKLNVRDSKKMSDDEIKKIAPIISKKLIYSILVLSPHDYNLLVKKGYNLNKIKAKLHNQVYIKTITKYPKPVPVILDQFCSKENYFSYLKDEKFVHRDIIFYEKAETVHKSVAAAAVIARYIFLKSFELLESKFNLTFPKGAGNNATSFLEELVKLKGEKILNIVCKANFKNVKKVLNK